MIDLGDIPEPPNANPESAEQAQLRIAFGLGVSGMGYKFHDADAGAVRPIGYASVRWVGSVEPTNAITNDIWDDTSL